MALVLCIKKEQSVVKVVGDIAGNRLTKNKIHSSICVVPKECGSYGVLNFILKQYVRLL